METLWNYGGFSLQGLKYDGSKFAGKLNYAANTNKIEAETSLVKLYYFRADAGDLFPIGKLKLL